MVADAILDCSAPPAHRARTPFSAAHDADRRRTHRRRLLRMESTPCLGDHDRPPLARTTERQVALFMASAASPQLDDLAREAAVGPCRRKPQRDYVGLWQARRTHPFPEEEQRAIGTTPRARPARKKNMSTRAERRSGRVDQWSSRTGGRQKITKGEAIVTQWSTSQHLLI